MTNSSHDSRATTTVVAVCGCGHDGRLGLGSMTAATASTAQHTTPSTSRITLVPAFLPRHGDDTDEHKEQEQQCTTRSLPSLVGHVRSVHCGAYHTIAHTSRGLYGWGVNEDGQLGLGTRVCTVHTPTRLTFFDALYTQWRRQRQRDKKYVTACMQRQLQQRWHDNDDDDDGKDNGDDDGVAEFVLRVSCGAKHTLVQTVSGVYVTGCNEHGQLGLAHRNTTHTWMVLCTLPLRHPGVLPRPLMPPSYDPHCNNDMTKVLLGEFGQRVAYVGAVTHLSAGTHHTVMACRDVLVCEEDKQLPSNSSNNNNSDDEEKKAERQAAQEERCFCYYRLLLLACGQGDYGELGNDGDAWQRQRTRDERAARALQQQLQQQQQQQQHTDDNDNITSSSSSALPAAVARWADKQRRLRGGVQRRAALTSPALQPVRFALLHEAAAVRVSLSTLLSMSAACDDGGGGGDGMHTALTRLRAQSRCVWAVSALCAMQLHTAVTLTRTHHSSGDDVNDANDAHATTPREVTYHWGCYYGRGVIEDDAASQPRRVSARSANKDDDGDNGEGDNDNSDEQDEDVFVEDDATDACVTSTTTWRMHAGNDIALRYRGARVEVVGSGVTGRNNNDDDDIQSWATLSYRDADGDAHIADDDSNNNNDNRHHRDVCRRMVHVTGRGHTLLLEQTMLCSRDEGAASADAAAAAAATTTTRRVRDVVYGFGDNLHGQLGCGSSLSRSSSGDNNNNNNNEDSDNVVLRPRRLLQCGDVLHSAQPQCNSGGSGACDVSSSSWRVQRIRSVGAGAAHSVFVVDVSPA